MRIRIFGILFVIALLAIIALFVSETPSGLVQDIRSRGLPWIVLTLALIIPLTMGAFWAMKPKHNPWNRKSVNPAPKGHAGGTDPAGPEGFGRQGQDR